MYCFIETDSSENRENEPPIENDSDDDSLCDETDSHCTESRRFVSVMVGEQVFLMKGYIEDLQGTTTK